MFTYFKKKEDEQKSTQQKQTQFIEPGQSSNSSSSNNSKYEQLLSSSLKLPSNIFAQLLSQSAPVQNITGDQNQDQGPSERKQSFKEGQNELANDGVKQQQNNQNTHKKQGMAKMNSQTGEAQVKQQKISEITQIKSNSRPVTPVQQSETISHKLPIPVKLTTLSSLSQPQLSELFSMFTNTLTQIIQAQLIGQQFNQQDAGSTLLPSTIQTIKKLNSTFYQQFILQTKQKYNHLVDQSTNLYLKSRQIANLFNQFVMSINLFFQSQELAIPAQQIQKAISELNPQKTQKYMNYLIKIFQANFDDVIEKRVKSMKLSLQTQIRKSEKLIKQLQQQVKRVSLVLKQKQSTFTEQQSKYSEKQLIIASLKRQINQLNIKLNSISSSSKQTQQDYTSQLSLLKKQLQRAKKQSEQLADKNKKQLKLLQKKDNLLKEKQQEIQNLGKVIKKVKQVQNQGMENIVQEMQMKEKMFTDKIHKFSAEKIQLQQKIRTLVVDRETSQAKIKQLVEQALLQKEEIKKLKEDIILLKETLNSTTDHKQQRPNNRESQEQSDQQQDNNNIPSQKSKPTKSTSNNHFQQNLSELQPQIDTSNLINKQIFKHLFLSFDDESKQWAIRNNIRHQIYIMLDIKKGSNSNTGNSHQIKEHKTVGNNNKGNIVEVSGGNQENKNQQQLQEKKSTEGSLIGKWLGW